VLNQTLRVEHGLVGGGTDRFGGAGDVGYHTGSCSAGTNGRSMVISGPGNHLAGGIESNLGCHLWAHLPDHRGRVDHPGKQLRVDATRLQHLFRPIPAGDIEKHRRGSVGVVLGNLTGKPGGGNARRRQEVGRALIEPVQQPHHLRGSVRRIAVQARHCEHAIGADLLLDDLGVGGSPPVHPDDRRMQWNQILVGRRHAVDLGIDSHVADRSVGLGRELRHHLGQRLNPLDLVLFGPAGSLKPHPVRGRGYSPHTSVVGNQDPLGALGPDVATDDETHTRFSGVV